MWETTWGRNALAYSVLGGGGGLWYVGCPVRTPVVVVALSVVSWVLLCGPWWCAASCRDVWASASALHLHAPLLPLCLGQPALNPTPHGEVRPLHAIDLLPSIVEAAMVLCYRGALVVAVPPHRLTAPLMPRVAPSARSPCFSSLSSLARSFLLPVASSAGPVIVPSPTTPLSTPTSKP